MAGFIKRFFRKAPILKSADGKELVALACNLLTSQIDFGNASPGGANRHRLERPYARGFVFGFVEALVQTGGIADKTHTRALISVVHAKIFGRAMGSVFIADALSSLAPDAAFTAGRAAGATDLKRRLADSGVPPRMLSDYLNSLTP